MNPKRNRCLGNLGPLGSVWWGNSVVSVSVFGLPWPSCHWARLSIPFSGLHSWTGWDCPIPWYSSHKHLSPKHHQPEMLNLHSLLRRNKKQIMPFFFFTVLIGAITKGKKKEWVWGGQRGERNELSPCARNKARHFGIHYIISASQAWEGRIIFHILQDKDIEAQRGCEIWPRTNCK